MVLERAGQPSERAEAVPVSLVLRVALVLTVQDESMLVIETTLELSE